MCACDPLMRQGSSMGRFTATASGIISTGGMRESDLVEWDLVEWDLLEWE